MSRPIDGLLAMAKLSPMEREQVYFAMDVMDEMPLTKTNLPPQFSAMREQHIAGPQVEVLGEDQTIEVVTLCAMCSDGESAGMHWPCDTIKVLDHIAYLESDIDAHEQHASDLQERIAYLESELSDAKRDCDHWAADYEEMRTRVVRAEGRVEAAEAEHQAFMDLFQTNFVLGTPPELEPEDIHEWFTRELKMSRAEFAKRATVEDES